MISEAMNRGAQHISQDAIDSPGDDRPAAELLSPIGETLPATDIEPAPEPIRTPLSERLFVALLVLLAVAWLAAAGWSVWLTHPDGRFAPAELVPGVGLACAPLALLALLFLITQRTSARAARRFGETAAAMHAQARSLDAVMNAIGQRIAENRAALAAQAEQLLALGEESAGRLAQVTESLRLDTVALGRQSKALEGAAASAKTDMAVLVADMPRAEADARAMAATLKDAGLRAHEEASALAASLATLSARSQEAEEHAGGAAQRLDANIARIESSSAVAGGKIDDVAAKLTGAIESALSSAAAAVDHSRQGIDAQNAALTAMVAQAQAALDRAGNDSSAALSLRIDQMSAQIDRLAAQLATHDATGRAIMSTFDAGIAGVEARFTAVDEAVTARTANLADTVGNLTSCTEQMTNHLDSSNLAADALIQRAGSLRTTLDLCFHELGETLPQALARLEQQASSSRATITATLPEMMRLETSASAVASRLRDAETTVERQRGDVNAMFVAIDEKVEAMLRKAMSLDEVILNASAQATRFADAAGPQLIEALLRVRETAVQAAERAREALAEVIPDSAAAIGFASGAAIKQAVGEHVTTQVARIAEVAEQALATASRASDKLMRQMLTIADTSASVEARIAEAQQEVEHANQETFSRQAALLVESLNSTAIDVTKILSNEVTDGAWASYLRGDRGIFTRRAVRLIDSGEARRIARHYEREPEFRNQVNRYIHDFEAMLRPVLANRDGMPLGVTLLSSDMGKLYVALAQAIERLRK